MAAFSLIDLDFEKATPLVVLVGAGVGAWLLVRYLTQQNAAQAAQAPMDAAGAATNQYLGTIEQEAELSTILGDVGSTASTGSSASTGVTYSGAPQNVPAAGNTSAIGGSTGSAIANTSPGALWANQPA